MPKARDPAAFRLYIDARKRWRSKIEWQFTKEELLNILADVTLASEQGDWGARALLAHFHLQGLGPMPSNKVLERDGDKSVAIARMAVAAGQPWGFYDVGVAHEHGYGGAYYDLNIAWAYYLKAAQLGSPEAQMALAQAYGKAGRRNAEEKMIRCAYEQGHGPAAYDLAMSADIHRLHMKALRLYQDGVKFGSESSAASLFLMFGDLQGARLRGEVLTSLGFSADPERYRRYKEIDHALEINPDLKFGRLDQAVPLPPANLPEWRGIEDAMDPEPSGPPTY